MLLMIDNAIGIGLQTLGLGMGIVVSMLMLLAVVLYVVIPIFRKISERKTKKSKDKAPAAETVKTAVDETVAEHENDEETVAAIIAAIAAYEGKAPEGFRVVSFKRL